MADGPGSICAVAMIVRFERKRKVKGVQYVSRSMDRPEELNERVDVVCAAKFVLSRW